VASAWPLYRKGLIGGVLQKWLSFSHLHRGTLELEFPTPYGVKQIDLLSPILFALALQIKHAKLGVEVVDIFLGILLYAD
jgi:hypothetical protein